VFSAHLIRVLCHVVNSSVVFGSEPWLKTILVNISAVSFERLIIAFCTVYVSVVRDVLLNTHKRVYIKTLPGNEEVKHTQSGDKILSTTLRVSLF